MKYLLIGALCLPLLVSCGKEIVVKKEFIEVQVPVPVAYVKAPEQELVKLIELSPVDQNDYDKITKSILINNTIRDNKIKQLETLLDGYREKK